MRKLYKLVGPIAILVFTLAAGIRVHNFFFERSVWLSTESPNKTYTVELTGDKGRGGFLFFSTVRFDAIKNGQTIVTGAHAHSGDFMDISFELAYPEHAWLGENVIRFWRNPDVPESNSDAIFLSNDSGKVIRYLKVDAKDMFLAFDLQPNSKLKLSPSHQSWGAWIASEGEFIDGQRISWKGANFFHRNKLSEPLRYCVSVSDEGLKIESQQVEEYDPNGSSDNPNVPKTKDCSP